MVSGVVPQPTPSSVTRAPGGSLVTTRPSSVADTGRPALVAVVAAGSDTASDDVAIDARSGVGALNAVPTTDGTASPVAARTWGAEAAGGVAGGKAAGAGAGRADAAGASRDSFVQSNQRRQKRTGNTRDPQRHDDGRTSDARVRLRRRWRQARRDERAFELDERGVLVQSDGARIRANLRAAVHAVWNDGQIATLERIEVTPRDFRFVGHLQDGQSSAFTRAAQELTELRAARLPLNSVHTPFHPRLGGPDLQFCPRIRLKESSTDRNLDRLLAWFIPQ